MGCILITGGAGFIGLNLASRLARRGDDVVIFDIAQPPRLGRVLAEQKNITFVHGEITEWPQIASVIQAKKPEAIVHCAAIVGVTNSVASPLSTFRVNVDGSLNVLEAMRLFGVRRMINLSSEETYGPFDADTIDETHPNRPVKPYGISKYAVERLACDYVANYGLECLHARTCWVYGPGLPRPRAPKIFVDAAVGGTQLHLSHGGDFVVDQVHSDDCVEGLVRMLDKPHHRFDIYHITSGEAHPMSATVEIIKSLVPDADISIGPGQYRYVDGTETIKKGRLDITRARTELGYEPRHSLRSGLATYIEATRAGNG